MQFRRYIFLVAALLLTLSCTNEDFLHDAQSQDGPVTVGFWMGGSSSGDTRTAINDDGQTVAWVSSDKVALWAKPENTTDYTFTNQTFDTWFVSADNSQAYFTATLGSEMPEGQYSYYACYPVPQSVSGTTATFTIPATQNGKMGEGADIMVAQGTGPALAKLYTPEPEEGETSDEDPNYVLDQNRLFLDMHHLVHALRFYVPDTKWGFNNETIERIVFTMPQTVAGEFITDVSAYSPTLSNPTSTSTSTSITLDLSENMVASTSGENGVEYDYAVAAIAPPSTTYGANDKMVVTVYSQKRFVTQEISLSGRGPDAQNEKMRMAAGRVTPVGLDCSTTSERPKISFRIKSNNLGEQPYKITITSENPNTKWKRGDDYDYEYFTGSYNSTIDINEGFDIYYDFADLSTISKQKVTVTYESKSAIVTEKIEMPEMTLEKDYEVKLNVPFLFAENFEGWSNTYHWQKKENSLSSINEWYGNQWRATNGILGICSYVGNYDSITITDAYHGRIDTPIISSLKKGVKVMLNISFSISMDDNASNGDTGCIYGFSTSTKVGGYTSVTNPDSDNYIRNTPDIIIEELTSNNNSHSKNYQIDNVPDNLRLTWFADINRKSGTIYSGFGERWFNVYIDNVTVKIDNN